MIPSIITLKEDMKIANERLDRIERLILTNHPGCNECMVEASEIVVEIQKEHDRRKEIKDVDTNEPEV